MTPRSRKSGDGLLLGCRSGLDRETFKSIFCDDFERTQKINDGNIFTVCSGSLYRNRSGVVRGRISREGDLEVRESRERRDKIVPNCSPEKTGKTRNNLANNINILIIYLYILYNNFRPLFLAGSRMRIARCSRESTSARQNYRQKQPKKKKKKIKG